MKTQIGLIITLKLLVTGLTGILSSIVFGVIISILEVCH